jgi:hypothetical protein
MKVLKSLEDDDDKMKVLEALYYNPESRGPSAAGRIM